MVRTGSSRASGAPIALPLVGNRKRKAERDERARQRLLALRVDVGMEQADSDRFGPAARGGAARALQLGAGQAQRDLTVEIGPFRDPDPHRARDQRLGPRRRERIKLAAVLAPDLDKVFEAGVGQQQHARALALQQRIGRDGRAVGDQFRSGAGRYRFKRRFKSGDDRARRIVGCREHLVHAQPPVAGEDNQVGERAAGVDADDNGA
jgi:hypothetical protein